MRACERGKVALRGHRPSDRHRLMRVKPRFLIGGGLIVAAIAYLIVTAIRNTAEYYLTVDEVQARAGELRGQRLRIAGRVKPASITWDPESLTLGFAIRPLPDSKDSPTVQKASASSAAAFAVICKGQPKPDMFAENRDVIVEGRLGAANTIEATQVLTSCPSKYD